MIHFSDIFFQYFSPHNFPVPDTMGRWYLHKYSSLYTRAGVIFVWKLFKIILNPQLYFDPNVPILFSRIKYLVVYFYHDHRRHRHRQTSSLSSSSTETKMSSFWRNFHNWLHWKLSFWQLPQPEMKISSKWRHFRFNDIVVIKSGVNKHTKGVNAGVRWMFFSGKQVISFVLVWITLRYWKCFINVQLFSTRKNSNNRCCHSMEKLWKILRWFYVSSDQFNA